MLRLHKIYFAHLKDDDATALVTSGQQLAIVIEFHAGYDVCIRDIIV